jgi:sulfur carrier protein ThiS adenylyltransferase
VCRGYKLIDPEVVEPPNLAAQGYLEDDLDRPKVVATADLCQQINQELAIVEVQARFRRSLKLGNVLFCCVDSIETRKRIWEATRNQLAFFADGRMSAEVLRILVASDEVSRRHYPTTLFAESEAHVGSCTAKSTIFCANIAAGLMLEQFSRWMRGLPVEADLCLNLLASELTIAPST